MSDDVHDPYKRTLEHADATAATAATSSVLPRLARDVVEIKKDLKTILTKLDAIQKKLNFP